MKCSNQVHDNEDVFVLVMASYARTAIPVMCHQVSVLPLQNHLYDFCIHIVG